MKCWLLEIESNISFLGAPQENSINGISLTIHQQISLICLIKTWKRNVLEGTTKCHNQRIVSGFVQQQLQNLLEIIYIFPFENQEPSINKLMFNTFFCYLNRIGRNRLIETDHPSQFRMNFGYGELMYRQLLNILSLI